MATEFSFGVREFFSAFSINGLDENFETSLELSRKLLTAPNIAEEKWSETKKIILSERDDEQKNPNAISNALAHYHRYGEQSRYRKRPSDEEINATSVQDLVNSLNELLDVDRSILYFDPENLKRLRV